MKVARSLAIALVAHALLAPAAAAQSTANQTVTYAVSAIDELSVGGGAVALTVNAATAGSQPSAVQSTGLTYAITTNGTSKKITAQLNANTASGVTLQVQLAAPSGGTSAGAVTLGTVAADVVTGITRLAGSALGLTYTLSATAAAGVVTATPVTVTYTIM